MLETVTRALESLQDGRGNMWEPYGVNRSKQHVNVKRCWKDISRCYGNLWNVVGRCWEWEMLGSGYDVMICHDRFWWIQMVVWILASCLVAWVGTEISVPAL